MNRTACAEIIAFSTSQTRAIAVGGAYFSAEDDLYSAQWNPASFGKPGYVRRPDLRVWLSPVPPVRGLLALRTRDINWNRDDRLSAQEAVLSVSSGVKGIAFNWGTWSLGFVNDEEPLRPAPPEHRGWSPYNGVTGGRYTVALAFRLAPQVSLGASMMYDRRAYDAPGQTIVASGWGSSYGVLLRPSPKVNFGLTYVQRADTLAALNGGPIPGAAWDRVPPLSRELERIDSGTLNGAVSYYPWKGTALFFDVRNLDESDKRFGFAEIHVGAEQTIAGLVSLRIGYYRDRDETTGVYSGGIGVKPPWVDRDADRAGRVSDMIAYTFVYQHHVDWNRKWHMVSMFFPLVF